MHLALHLSRNWPSCGLQDCILIVLLFSLHPSIQLLDLYLCIPDWVLGSLSTKVPKLHWKPHDARQSSQMRVTGHFSLPELRHLASSSVLLTLQSHAIVQIKAYARLNLESLPQCACTWQKCAKRDPRNMRMTEHLIRSMINHVSQFFYSLHCIHDSRRGAHTPTPEGRAAFAHLHKTVSSFNAH